MNLIYQKYKFFCTFFLVSPQCSLAGFVIFIPISLANRPFRRTMKLALFSLFAVSCFTIPPFLGMLYWMRGIPHSSEYTQPEKVASTIKFKVELFVVFASGLGLLFCILLLILATVIYLYTGEKSQFVTFWVSTHDVIASYCGKQAGTSSGFFIWHNLLE